MTLKEDEYKVQNDGIWISRTALEEFSCHYRKLCVKAENDNSGMGFYYMGKHDILEDILGHFDYELP